jgi:hypothetical protein
MSIVQKTKNKAGEYFLRSEAAGIQRKRKAANLDSADTIAIIFDATDNTEFDIIKKYIKKLKEDKRKVRALGFYDAKDSPAIMASKLEYDFFTRKQLKWYLKPDDPIIQNFLDEPFDILINLSLHPKTPILYLVALSHAGFKVGASHKKFNPWYDLIIQTPLDNLNTLIANTEKVLAMIKSKP